MKNIISEIKDFYDIADRKWQSLDKRVQFSVVFVLGIAFGVIVL